jgi:hypothetical protein
LRGKVKRPCNCCNRTIDDTSTAKTDTFRHRPKNMVKLGQTAMHPVHSGHAFSVYCFAPAACLFALYRNNVLQNSAAYKKENRHGRF